MMDNYTKMCDCPEIQDGWEPKVGDWTDKGVIISKWGCMIQALGCELHDEKGSFIYLPGIRQLMGMVKPSWWGWKTESLDAVDFTELFEDYITGLSNPRECPYKELLLRWIMHMGDNKKWSGKRKRWEQWIRLTT